MATVTPMPALYAGFGCRRDCSMLTLQTLLGQVLSQYGWDISALRGFASIIGKTVEPGLQQLAAHYALPLLGFSADQLRRFEPQLSHRSTLAHAHTGCWGVAESAALALACSDHPAAQLIVTRQVLGPATLALACPA